MNKLQLYDIIIYIYILIKHARALAHIEGKMYRCFFKRFCDILIAFIGLILCLIPMLIIAVAIKVNSKGPVIFKQERVGKNGKVFKMYKFRSMCVGAEQQEGGVFCVKGDKRVTKVGKILRATSLDEIPQFINILI